MPPTVKLTAVVVTKRHHTRFFPISAKPPDKTDARAFPVDRDGWGKGNTVPGTCVDQLVTSPYYQDFFLQSHSGVKGTAKPAHYFVIEDGVPGLSLANLRDLTHAICYSYARAPVGVSYASPTYYADHLCERGRLYVRDFFSKDHPTLEIELATEKSRLIQSKKSARDTAHAINAKMTDDEKTKTTKSKKAQEIVDRKEIDLMLKDFVYHKMYDEFYVFRNDGWMNPWSKELANTMFWM